jgi:hypothetical protein
MGTVNISFKTPNFKLQTSKKPKANAMRDGVCSL